METKIKHILNVRMPLLKYAATNLKSERGSITLESAFVIPVSVFLACLSIYIVLLLFEQAQLQSSSDYAAHSAASVWRGDAIKRDAGGEGETASNGGTLISDNQIANLYHRMFDPNIEEKSVNVSNIAVIRFGDISLSGYTQTFGEAKYRNGIFGKTLFVELQGLTIMPNQKVTSTFGFGNVFSGEYPATSLLPDFAENIRCIDYVIEIEKKLKEASPEYADIANGFQDIIGQIREYIGGIL